MDNKDADQTVQMQRLIHAFDIRIFESRILKTRGINALVVRVYMYEAGFLNMGLRYNCIGHHGS